MPPETPQAPMTIKPEPPPRKFIGDLLKSERASRFRPVSWLGAESSVGRETKFAPVPVPAGQGEAGSSVHITPVNRGDTPYDILKRARLFKYKAPGPPARTDEFRVQAKRRLEQNRQGTAVYEKGTQEEATVFTGGDQQPPTYLDMEWSGVGYYGARVASGLTLGATSKLTGEFEREFMERYSTGKHWLDMILYEAGPMAATMALWGAPGAVGKVAQWTPTAMAWNAAGGAARTMGSVLTGGRVPAWVAAGARMKSLQPLYQGRWFRQMAGSEMRFAGTRPGRALMERFGEGVRAQVAGVPLRSLDMRAAGMTPVDWAAKWFGWRAAQAVSPKLYAQLHEVLRLSGGRIGENGRIFIPEGKYYGYAKRVLGMFKSRAGRAGVKLEITSNPQDLVATGMGLKDSLTVYQAATSLGGYSRATLAAKEAVQVVAGSAGVGAGFGAVTPEAHQTDEEYWAQEQVSRGEAAWRGAKSGAAFGAAFVPAMAAFRGGKHALQDRRTGPPSGPQRLLGVPKGPEVRDGAVVVRPEPKGGPKTPRQSLHNMSPEPPLVKVPLVGEAGFDFLRVTGMDSTWISDAEYEQMMAAYPELAHHRRELDLRRHLKKQLETAAMNMREGAQGEGDATTPEAGY